MACGSLSGAPRVMVHPFGVGAGVAGDTGVEAATTGGSAFGSSIVGGDATMVCAVSGFALGADIARCKRATMSSRVVLGPATDATTVASAKTRT